MDWQECKTKKLVKEFNASSELIESLKVQGNKKFETAKRIVLDSISASTKFCDFYDSLRITLETIALIKGFKIYNHECYHGFIKEILKLDEESFAFNKLRILRNSINYYGEDLSPESAEKLINETIKLRKSLLMLI